MTNSNLIKIGGAFAVVCILFFPMVGCGPVNLSGLDILTESEVKGSMKLFIGIALICGIVLFLVKEKIATLFASLSGIVALLLAYVMYKSEMKSNDDFDMSQAAELKSGSYASLISFIISAILSVMKSDNKNPDSNNPQS